MIPYEDLGLALICIVMAFVSVMSFVHSMLTQVT